MIKKKLCLFLTFLFIILFPHYAPPETPEELITVGIGTYKDGLFDIAKKQFERFVGNYPKHEEVPKVLYLLAEIYQKEGNLSHALKTLSKIKDNYPHYPLLDSVLFRMGEMSIEIKDEKKAEEYLGQLIKNFPKSHYLGKASYLIAHILISKAQYNEAREYLKKAFSSSEDEDLLIKIKFYWALTSYKLKDYQEAEKTLNFILSSKVGAVRKQPLLKDSSFLLCKVLLEKGLLGEAKEKFKEFLKTFPNDPLVEEALLDYEYCLENLGETKEATDQLQSFKKKFPQSDKIPEVLFQRGKLLVSLGDFQGATEEFKALVNAYPKHTLYKEGILQLGWSLVKLKDFKEASNVMEKVLSMGPQDKEKTLAFFLLAESYFYLGDGKKALPFLEEIAKKEEFRKEALLKMAKIHLLNGNYKEALSLSTLLEDEDLFFKRKEALEIKVNSLFYLKRYVRAAEAYSTFMDLFSKDVVNPEILYRYGFSLSRIGEEKKSLEIFLDLYNQYPQHPLAKLAAFPLGMEYLDKKDYRRAIGYFLSSSQVSDKEIQQQSLLYLGEIYFLMKQYRESINNFQELVERFPPEKGKLALVYLKIGMAHEGLREKEKAIEAYKKILLLSEDAELKKALQEKISSLGY